MLVVCDVRIRLVYEHYLQLEKEFHISQEVATVGLTTYVLGLGLGPMFLSPLSEFYGRRTIYLWAFGMFFIW